MKKDLKLEGEILIILLKNFHKDENTLKINNILTCQDGGIFAPKPSAGNILSLNKYYVKVVNV